LQVHGWLRSTVRGKRYATGDTANNPNAPEQSQAIGELQRLSVSGDWERSTRDSKSFGGVGRTPKSPSLPVFRQMSASEYSTSNGRVASADEVKCPTVLKPKSVRGLGQGGYG
jgi:hypothetical protein